MKDIKEYKYNAKGDTIYEKTTNEVSEKEAKVSSYTTAIATIVCFLIVGLTIVISIAIS